ncbi:SPFH domain-containing protein [Streptomyces sp. NRRL S-244]|uniref:SPFH domain-containing protein n=1 Tax=Streptomyces sp. NRRL S-244 TaxID=1463897 RepID=UPI00068D912E|nr:SPFH domain-containing protein [Streptomyces sp. NRRL S-244]
MRERPGRALSGRGAVAVAVVATAGCLLALVPVLEGVRIAGHELSFPVRLPAPAALREAAVPICAITAVAAAVCAFLALAGLTWGRDGSAVVLSRRGSYRGTVRRTGLLWVPPLSLRYSVDVRLRHWRSEAIRGVDRGGVAFQAVVLVVWRVRDTARAVFGVESHEACLGTVVESAVCQVLAATAAHGRGGPDALYPSYDADGLAAELTAAVAAECRAVGLDVYSVQPFHIEFAPDIAAAMRGWQLRALDAQLRQADADDVVAAVTSTVDRLLERDVLSCDDRQRCELVTDLSIALHAARGAGPLRGGPGEP